MAERRGPLLVINMRVTANAALLVCSVAMTTALALVVFGDALGSQGKAAYDEIDVGRINVREQDGSLRLVISNQSRFPGLYFQGKEHPHPNRKTAGLLFFNEEGTENGGLIFGGRKVDGKVTSGGHLSFDRYEQDQVVQITHDEEGERRWAGLAVHDYPDGSTDLDAWERAEAMPEGPEKVAELKRLQERYGAKRRVFLGRQRDRAARLIVNDAAGHPRLLLEVVPEGAARDPLPGRRRQSRAHRDSGRQAVTAACALAEKSLPIIVVGTGAPPVPPRRDRADFIATGPARGAAVRRLSRAAFSHGAGSRRDRSGLRLRLAAVAAGPEPLCPRGTDHASRRIAAILRAAGSSGAARLAGELHERGRLPADSAEHADRQRRQARARADLPPAAR